MQKNCTKKIFMTQIIMHVITHLEPDILECEVKCTLGSITMNKASGGDGIPIELFLSQGHSPVFTAHTEFNPWLGN